MSMKGILSMKKKAKRLLFLFLITAALAFTIEAFAADALNPQGGVPGGAPGGAPAGMPGGMPGGAGDAGGGMPSFGGAPDKAAIYIVNGAENTGKEYVAGKYKANVSADAKGVKISNLNFSTDDYTVNGIAITGEKSFVTVENAKMHLGVTKESSANPGAALIIDEKATVYLNNSDLTVDGAGGQAGRYVTFNPGGTLIVNNSKVTQTGPNQFTSKIAEPFSNDALLISGNARANMSTGTSKTYYFNSTVTTEGWASLSTDSGRGVELYAYNTKAIAQNGGYGNYADWGCRVFLYGSNEDAAEIGVIIANSGEMNVADGASAPAEIMKYNLGKTTTAGSVITGGRNAIMIHTPDMQGVGLAAADNGFLNVKNSTLATSKSLKTTRDYAAHLSKAVDAYINYTMGADILVKSTSAAITLENTKFETFSGVAVMSVLNSDSMGNFLKDEGDGAKVKPIAVSMKNMSVTGDIKHMDYQRIMTLSLENVALKGAVVSGTVEEWNKLWTAFPKKDCNWVQNDKWNTFYGVRMTVKKGSVWQVTGPSLLSSLTVEDGGTVKGKVKVDGKDVVPAAGKTYTGKIAVSPL